jgi:hypothetical protein
MGGRRSVSAMIRFSNLCSWLFKLLTSVFNAVILTDWAWVACVGVVKSETWDRDAGGFVERAATWAQRNPETETVLRPR